MEDKEAFVNDVVEALIKYGGGRYDRYAQLHYEDLGGVEVIECNGTRYNVTGDSLTSLMATIRHIVG